MDISGYVVLGIVTLFLTYLVPQLIRDRQDLADCRLSDRFSADLRILTTAKVPGSGVPVPAVVGPSRTYLHGPRLRTEVSAMNRPPLDLVSSPSPRPGRPPASAASRPAGPKEREAGVRSIHDLGGRRRAAARRRLALTLVLLGLAGWAWAAVATSAAPGALAAPPTVLLAVVLVLGRRAAAAATRAERAGRTVRPVVRPAPAGIGPSGPTTGTPARRPERSRPDAAGVEDGLRPAASPRRALSAAPDATTEILPRLVEHLASGGTAPSYAARGQRVPAAPAIEAAGADLGARSTAGADLGARSTAGADLGARSERRPEPDLSRSWTPVPVPAPTYTLKPSAPRTTRRPAPAEQTYDAAVRTQLLEAEGLEVAQPGQGDGTPSGPGTGAGNEELRAERTPGAVPAPAAAAAADEEALPPAQLDLDAVLSRRRAAGE